MLVSRGVKDELGPMLRTTVEPYEHVFLNEIAPFDDLNPTAENIARVVFENLSAKINDDRVKVVHGNALETDLSKATVVTLYLLTASNLKLRPLLTKELKPGARIVSHMFSMGDWEPAKVDNFTNQEGFPRTLYLWKADGKYRP